MARIGRIVVSQRWLDRDDEQSRVTVRWGDAAQGGPRRLDCTSTRVSDRCEVIRCASSDFATRAPSAEVDYGDLAITAGGGTKIVSRWNSHVWLREGEPLVLGGERVELRGEGGIDVPPFTLALDAPPAATWAFGDPITLARGEAWTITWGDRATGTFAVELFTLESNARARCVVPANEGAATFPGEATAPLAGMGFLRVVPTTSTRTHVGDWDVDVVVEGSMAWREVKVQ